MHLLSSTLEAISEKFGEEPIITGGDFKGRAGLVNDRIPKELLQGSVLLSDRVCLDVKKEKEGRLLIEMMNEGGQFLLNGRVPGDCPGQFTFSSSLGSSAVDYCWVNAPALGLVQSMVVWDEIFSSDHFLIMVHFFTEESEMTGFEANVGKSMSKFKWVPECCNEFSEKVEQSLSNRGAQQGPFIEWMNECLKEVIMSAARDLGMVAEQKGPGQWVGHENFTNKNGRMMRCANVRLM